VKANLLKNVINKGIRKLSGGFWILWMDLPYWKTISHENFGNDTRVCFFCKTSKVI